MLFSIDYGVYVKSVPHPRDYNEWKKNLPQADMDAIKTELNKVVDAGEIHTSSWIPGSNWIGTIYEPIYWAMKENIPLAGMFFGLILFDVMIERDEVWGFGKYQVDGVDIKGTTYFELKNPPPK